MINMLTKWFNRNPVALPQTKQSERVTLPDNMEEYYLATLYFMQDDMRRGSSMNARDTFDRLYEIMTEKLNAGTWHPNATLEDRPTEYWQNKKHQEWEALVFYQEDWFRQAMRQLIEITSSYMRHKDAQIKLIEERHEGMYSSYATNTPKDFDKYREESIKASEIREVMRYSYIEIASGFCSYIAIDRTSNPSGFVRYEPCRLSLEFQGEHWEFDCPKGVFHGTDQQGGVTINGRVFYESYDYPVIKQYQIKMMKVIAQHSVEVWQRTRLLAWLEQQPVIKEAAQTLSEWIDGCYHEHMVEIYYRLQKPFDPSYIIDYYACFHRTDVMCSALIRDLYKDIYDKLDEKTLNIIMK